MARREQQTGPGFCLSHAEQKGYTRYPHCLHLEQSNYLSRIFSFPRRPIPGGGIALYFYPRPASTFPHPSTRNLKINRRPRSAARRSAKIEFEDCRFYISNFRLVSSRILVKIVVYVISFIIGSSFYHLKLIYSFKLIFVFKFVIFIFNIDWINCNSIQFKRVFIEIYNLFSIENTSHIHKIFVLERRNYRLLEYFIETFSIFSFASIIIAYPNM